MKASSNLWRKLSYLPIFLAFFAGLYGNRSHLENFVKHRQVHAISWDVYGYYAYLPFTLIYHDPGVENFARVESLISTYNPELEQCIYQYGGGTKGRRLIVYNIGQAYMYLPAFIAGHAWALFSPYPADGFSNPYQICLALWSICITLLGLLMLRKALLLLYNPSIVTITISLLLVASNYLSEAVLFSLSAHNFMFLLNAIILYLSIQLYRQPNSKKIIYQLALVLGLAVNARPIELLWALVPVLWGVYNMQTLKNKIVHYKNILPVILKAFALFLLCWVPQIVYWLYVGDRFMAPNLHSETLALSDPYLFKFLFSFRKGWILYTPLSLVFFTGFYFLYKNCREIFWPLFISLLINIYVLSSWECWWYASSFSQRSVVESYVFFSVPLAALLSFLAGTNKLIMRSGFMLIIAACVFLNLFQSWQYQNSIISYDRMSAKAYKLVWGKSYRPANLDEALITDRSEDKMTYDSLNFEAKLLLDADFKNSFLSQPLPLDSSCCGTPVAAANKEFISLFETRYKDLTPNDLYYFKLEASVYVPDSTAANSWFCVFAFQSGKKFIKYSAKTFAKMGAKPNAFSTISALTISPYMRHKSDKISIYLWNPKNHRAYFSNIKLTLLSNPNRPE